MTRPNKYWPSIPSTPQYQDASAAIVWLCEALRFEARVKVKGHFWLMEMVREPKGA